MRRLSSLLILLLVALPALRAAALAPVIGQIPYPIIGNQVTTGTSPRYVSADVFDLHALGYDDDTASDQLTWSYEIVGTPKYAVNGVTPINSVNDNQIHPPADSIVNRAMNTLPGADDPDPDGHPNTLTIRNINLYPYGDTPSMDTSPAAQDWDLNMQPVTFWCSDGTQATSATVMFYTDNTYTTSTGQPAGWNRLSPYT